MPAIDTVIQAGRVVVNDDPRQRYRNTILALSLAATPTDVALITGAAGKKVRILRIEVSGAAATASQIIPVQIVARSTAYTGGTQTAGTNVPIDSAFSAAVAVCARFTANPTVGTLVGAVDNAAVCFALATSAVATNATVFDFTSRNGAGYVLNSALEALAVNLNGVTLNNATTANIVIEWTEE